MNITNQKLASEVVNTLLSGMSLDSIRIYSVIVLLGFFRPASHVDLPSEVWISVSGELRLEPLNQAPKVETNINGDFFLQRASVLSELYLLIGKEASAASVSDSGVLNVEIGERRICAQANNDDLEEIWSVMSDSPDADKDHRWYVSLDDLGHVTVQSPD